MNSVFVFPNTNLPTSFPHFGRKMRDFRWLSGLTSQKLSEIGNREIDEDIDGVYSFQQILKPYLLPCLEEQIDRLEGNWRDICSRLDQGPASGTIPRIFHFVWLSVEPGEGTSPLRSGHLARAKSWLRKNGDAFEYWIWTDAVSEDDLNISVLRAYAAELGISERLRVVPRAQAQIDAHRHFRRDRYLKVSAQMGEVGKVSFSEVLEAVLEFSRSRNVGIRSDVLKFLILYIYGGVYLDINDTECIQPFKLLIEPFDFVACMEPQGYINTAIAAARRHSEVVLSYLCMLWRQRAQILALNSQVDLYQKHLKGDLSKQDDASRIRNAIDRLVVRRTGPIAFTKAILGYLSEPEGAEITAVLPSAYLYPGWGLMQSHTRNEWLKPVSYANHYDERAYVGHVDSTADENIRRALGELPGSSSVQPDGYL